MTTISKFKKFGLMAFTLAAVTLTSCEKEEEDDTTNTDDVTAPAEEHDHEVITDVHLVFTNVDDSTDVHEFHAVDPDGEGIQELTVEDEITLDSNKTYTLTFEILNTLEEDDHDDHDHHGHDHKQSPQGEGEDVLAEILEEADEHQVFFAFTNDAFSNPMGDGNIDNAADAVNYEDEDSNGLPLGLETTWTTGGAISEGMFRVVLQHQPGVKTATSSIADGDSDFDITFVLNIE